MGIGLGGASVGRSGAGAKEGGSGYCLRGFRRSRRRQGNHFLGALGYLRHWRGIRRGRHRRPAVNGRSGPAYPHLNGGWGRGLHRCRGSWSGLAASHHKHSQCSQNQKNTRGTHTPPPGNRRNSLPATSTNMSIHTENLYLLRSKRKRYIAIVKMVDFSYKPTSAFPVDEVYAAPPPQQCKAAPPGNLTREHRRCNSHLIALNLAILPAGSTAYGKRRFCRLCCPPPTWWLRQTRCPAGCRYRRRPWY